MLNYFNKKQSLFILNKNLLDIQPSRAIYVVLRRSVTVYAHQHVVCT